MTEYKEKSFIQLTAALYCLIYKYLIHESCTLHDYINIGGVSIPGWMYARGGGVIQMRTECYRGGGGGLKIGKKCVCN